MSRAKTFWHPSWLTALAILLVSTCIFEQISEAWKRGSL